MFSAFLVFFIFVCFNARNAQGNNGFFWHVTDFHWDLNYTQIGGNPQEMCWRTANSSSTNVGRFGNYNCDSPWTLVQSTVNFMKNHENKPDFIIWTGDDSAHVLGGNFTFEKVLQIMGNITNIINETFPTTPVFPVFGNHDAYPKHYFPPSTCELYVSVADLWKDWIKEGTETFRKGGYYAISHPTIANVKILGLNTPLYYQKNALVNSLEPDPTGQFAWLESTLEELSNKGMKAYIIGHVPPGIFGRKVKASGYYWFRPDFNRRYNSIVVKYAEVIISHLFGHDHTDSLKIYYNSAGTPVNVHFVAPAVTPWNTTLAGIGPNNPGVRFFTYNTTDGNIINYEQYYLNLTEANIRGNPDWQLEYNFKEAYGLQNVCPVSVNKVMQTFNTNNRTFFNKYYLYNSVSVTPFKDCDRVCQRNHYCAITQVDYNKFATCNSVDSIKGNSAASIMLNTKNPTVLALVFIMYHSVLVLLIRNISS